MSEPTIDPQHESRRFAIAVSFPGEHRRFVLNVVEQLAEALGRDRIFFDEWYNAELVGVDGDLKLRRYYREHSEVVVPFFSQFYQKPWCEIEWHAIRSMLMNRRSEDAVIPVEMDDTKIEGWESTDIGIRKKRKTASQIADAILAAYRYRFPGESKHLQSSEAIVSVSSIASAPPTVPQRSTPRESSRNKKRPEAKASPGSNAKSPRTATTDLAKEQMRPLVEQLLDSSVTREFILKHNQLPATTSAFELAKTMLQSAAPLGFLRNCTRREKPSSATDLDTMNSTIWRLTQILAPVCLQISDLSVLAKYLDGKASQSHAELPTSDVAVAKSQVALIRKVSVNLKTPVDWQLIRYQDLPRNDEVTAIPAPPHVGIYGDGGPGREDIVDVFTEGLNRLLHPHKPHRIHVRAALKEFADKDKVYVCMFLPARLSPQNFDRLREAYPELILLVQGASEDTEENATVLDQIQRIRNEFLPQND
ncbi:MAG TPA: toll/interleukin-1 receptor domain-containing protein [Planctomycetaceae bacterium]|nr:toll/interleukin-1 receptor domain-containing protein [Planctomycetaceae bacterium]